MGEMREENIDLSYGPVSSREQMYYICYRDDTK